MKEGQIILYAMKQADGNHKVRPVLLLRELPLFQDFLICGISSKTTLEVNGFDVVLDESHPDYLASGLHTPSLIRLGFLGVVPTKQFAGHIGQVSEKTHHGLLKRLSSYLLKDID